MVKDRQRSRFAIPFAEFPLFPCRMLALAGLLLFVATILYRLDKLATTVAAKVSKRDLGEETTPTNSLFCSCGRAKIHSRSAPGSI